MNDMQYILRFRLQKYIVILFSIIWLGLGFIAISWDLCHNYRDYLSKILLSLEEKRALVTEGDFYKFLKFCDDTIPKNKDIKWVLPAGIFLGFDDYYFYKAYYYLYPRNYREDAGYILVYKKKDYIAPRGYKLLAEFGEDKYILVQAALNAAIK